MEILGEIMSEWKKERLLDFDFIGYRVIVFHDNLYGEMGVMKEWKERGERENNNME